MSKRAGWGRRWAGGATAIAMLLAGGGAALGAPPHDLTIAVAGDLLGPYHPVLQLGDPALAEIVKLLRSADAGFANEEGSLFDLSDYKGYPAAENGGGNPLAPGAVAADFRAMGITMMSKANNHATDWNVDGLQLTERTLDAHGIKHAGSGASEAAARAPVFLDTAKGKLALVATASTFTPISRAADVGMSAHAPLRARPGISVIETKIALAATPDELAALRAMAARRGAKTTAGPVTLGSTTFVAGTDPILSYTAVPEDRDAVIGSVHQATDTGAFTILSIHAHETASGNSEDPEPAGFLQPLFHQAIDTGASLVVRHGPHALKGIEIYKGRPIFYGMASLFFDFGGRGLARPGKPTIPFPDTWFESAFALVHYHDGQLQDVRLYPITFEVSTGPTGGLPRLAHGDDAARILGRLKQYSAKYGTNIAIRGDVGVIEMAPHAP